VVIHRRSIRALLTLLLAATLVAVACRKDFPQPNVVVIMTDDLDVRTFEDNLDAFPNLGALKAHGVYFRRSYVSFPVCCPSRATFFSGLYPHNHGVWGNDADPHGGLGPFHNNEATALPTWLNTSYKTTLIGKYNNGYDGTYIPPGWDDFNAIYRDGGFGSAHWTSGATEGLTQAEFYGDKAASIIRNTKEPLFLYMAVHPPHEPSPYPARFAKLYGDRTSNVVHETDVSDKPPWIRGLKRIGTAKSNEIDETYRDWIRSTKDVDLQVAKVKKALSDVGELNNTYIIVTSDNGYHFGEHRIRVAKWTPYPEATRVPLLIDGPGVSPGTSYKLVLNNDLAPTIADVANVAPAYDPDGTSLMPLLRTPNTSAWRKRILIEAEETGTGGTVEMPKWHQVVTHKFIWTQYTDGHRELYWSGDPHQLNNEADAASDSFKTNLMDQVDRLSTCKGASCATAEGF
jgi:N-acetylglucosamine-6-sulfatase